MPLQYADAGIEAVLRASIGDAAVVEPLILRLFVNNVMPSSFLTAADFTEASFFGYAPKSLDIAGWAFVPSVMGQNPRLEQPVVEFRSTLEQNIQNVYGYYYTGAKTGSLRGYQIFDAGPYQIAHNADRIVFPPQLEGTSI